jgi:hypothetical protein
MGHIQQLPDWGTEILRTAAGAMRYANGDVYVGMYKDGKKHFQGGKQKVFSHTITEQIYCQSISISYFVCHTV